MIVKHYTAPSLKPSHGGTWGRLRLKVADRLVDFEKYGSDETGSSFAKSYLRLSKILGKSNGRITKDFNEEDARTCELLLGPHGYTIYKALCAQRGLD